MEDLGKDNRFKFAQLGQRGDTGAEDAEDSAKRYFEDTGIMVSPTTDEYQTWKNPVTGDRLNAHRAREISLAVRNGVGATALEG